jgi:hypothetical protein
MNQALYAHMNNKRKMKKKKLDVGRGFGSSGRAPAWQVQGSEFKPHTTK